MRCFGFSKAEVDSPNLLSRSIWGALKCSNHQSEFIEDYEAESTDFHFIGLSFSNSKSDLESSMSPFHIIEIKYATDSRHGHLFEDNSSLSQIYYLCGASSFQARTPKQLQRISPPLLVTIRSYYCNSPFR